MSDALRRGLRTAIDVFLGTLLASPLVVALPAMIANQEPVNWSAVIALVLSAGLAALIGLVNWAKNALEDKGQIKPVLKHPS